MNGMNNTGLSRKTGCGDTAAAKNDDFLSSRWGDHNHPFHQLEKVFPECSTNGKLNIDCMYRRLQAEFDSFAAEMQEMISALGVDISREVVLTAHGRCTIVCQDGHADKARIDEMLLHEPGLRIRFSRLAAMYNLVRAAGRVYGVREVAKRNPDIATNMYFHFAKTKERREFAVRFQSGHAEMYFDAVERKMFAA